MIIPDGHIVVTGYIRTTELIFESEERMAVGDVKQAYEEYLRLGKSSAWPCAFITWVRGPDGKRPKIADGRHRYIASLMLGREYMLVGWIVPDSKGGISGDDQKSG